MSLVILHLITSLEIGGAQAILYDVVNHLQQSGHHNHILYFADGPYKERLSSTGATMHHVQGCMSAYDPLFWYRLSSIIVEINPSIIHSCLWSANFAARIMGWWHAIPVMHGLHNRAEHNGLLRCLIDWSSVWLPHHAVAITDDVKRSFRSVYGKKTDGIQVIYNGIHADWVVSQARSQKILRADLGIPEDAFVIGAVGRLVPVKNHALLLQFFDTYKKNNPRAWLLIVGSGPLEKSLRDYAATLNSHASITFVTDAVAYGYYPLFDCFTVLTMIEGVFLALLEAMSCGVPPVVCSVTKEHPVICHGVNGLVVHGQKEQDVEDAWDSYASHTIFAHAVAIKARNTVLEQYSATHMVQKYRVACEYLSKGITRSDF